jgi:hypothetical protein
MHVLEVDMNIKVISVIYISVIGIMRLVGIIISPSVFPSRSTVQW